MIISAAPYPLWHEQKVESQRLKQTGISESYGEMIIFMSQAYTITQKVHYLSETVATKFEGQKCLMIQHIWEKLEKRLPYDT